MLTRGLGPQFDNSKCVIKVIKQLTFCSGITSANFEGGGVKTCTDNADTGGGNLGKLREGLKKNGLFPDID